MHSNSPAQVGSPSPMINYNQQSQQVGSPYVAQPSHQRVPSQPIGIPPNSYYQPSQANAYPSSHSPAAFSIPSPAYTNSNAGPNSPYSAPLAQPGLTRKFSHADSASQSTPGPSPVLATVKAPKKVPKITKKAQKLLDAAEAEETARVAKQEVLLQQQQQQQAQAQAQLQVQAQNASQPQAQAQLQAQLLHQQKQQQLIAQQQQQQRMYAEAQGNIQAAYSPGNPSQQVRVPSRGPGSTQQSMILQQQQLQQQAQERHRAQVCVAFLTFFFEPFTDVFFFSFYSNSNSSLVELVCNNSNQSSNTLKLLNNSNSSINSSNKLK